MNIFLKVVKVCLKYLKEENVIYIYRKNYCDKVFLDSYL